MLRKYLLSTTTTITSTTSPSHLILAASPSSFLHHRFCATSATKEPLREQSKEETPEEQLNRLRKDTDREVYEPGPIARTARKVIITATEAFGMRKKVAIKMEKGLKEVQKMEDESKWLRAHGSPLRVLGLPDSADLDDVKARYRNLLFEVHPDTAPQDDKKALAKLGLNDEQIRARMQTELDLLRDAYRIATTPNSLWHQDGNAPALLRELEPNLTLFNRVVNAQTVFPVVSWLYMVFVLFIVFSVVMKYVLDNGLYFVDPNFYKFMYKQEGEERRKREAGEEVDYNPKRLAPARFKRVISPGLYVNSVTPPEEESGFWQDEK